MEKARVCETVTILPIGLLNQDISIKVNRAHVPYSRVSGPQAPTITDQHSMDNP